MEQRARQHFLYISNDLIKFNLIMKQLKTYWRKGSRPKVSTFWYPVFQTYNVMVFLSYSWNTPEQNFLREKDCIKIFINRTLLPSITSDIFCRNTEASLKNQSGFGKPHVRTVYHGCESIPYLGLKYVKWFLRKLNWRNLQF